MIQHLNDPLPRAARGALGLIILIAATIALGGWPQTIAQLLGLGMLISGLSGVCPLATGGACAAPIPQAAPAPSDEGALACLHAQVLGRDYDLRTCNPAHGPFYGALASYKQHADDPAALRDLADSLGPWAAGERGLPELRDSYRELVALARWRADRLGATPR